MRFYLIVVILFLSSAFVASAADLGSNVINNIGNIQNLEKERRDENLKRLKDRDPVFLQEDEKKKEIGKSEDMGQCFQVHTIMLDGADSLSEKEKNHLVSNFKGQCLNNTDINNILKNITNYYVSKGLITTRAYLPQQNIKSGMLVIKVFEGAIESLEIKEPTSQSRLEKWTAFPGLKGELLNLRDLEQGLEQMNRLRSNGAKMELLPGTNPGFSKVVINNAPTVRLHGNLGYDNAGSTSTGKEQGKLGIQFDNLLGINDFMSLGLNKTLGDSQYRYSKSFDLFLSIPYGYSILSLSHTEFKYMSTVTGNVRSFETSGDSKTDYISLDHVFSRGKRSKLNGILSLTLKGNSNFIENAKIVASSRKLSVLKIGMNMTEYFSWGSLNAGLYYHKGLKIAAALEDKDTPPDSPKAQFDKGTFNLSLSIPFPSNRAFYQGTFQAQYASDKLYGSEQISIGGQYSIRGFHENGLIGDSGLYLRNEISMSILRNHWTPYLALDVGHAYKSYLEQYSHGTLLGGAAGLRVSYKYLRGGVVASAPIRHPSKVTPDVLTVLFNIELVI